MSWPTKTICPLVSHTTNCMSTSGNKPNHSVTGEHNLLQNKTAKCYPNHHSGNVCLGVHNYKTYAGIQQTFSFQICSPSVYSVGPINT